MIENTSVKIPLIEIKRSIKTKMDELLQKNPEYRNVLRISVETEPADPLRWLRVQKAEVKVFLSRRGERARSFAGAGCILKKTDGAGIDIAGSLKGMIPVADGETRLYGGMSFPTDQKRDGLWDSFGRFTFIIPRFEFSSDEEKGVFAVNLLSAENDRNGHRKIQSEMDELIFSDNDIGNDVFQSSVNHHSPEKGQWIKEIDDYLTLMGTGVLEKIVAARKTELDISGNVDPFRVLYALRADGDHAAYFLFCFDGENFFLGATPEVLFRRNGNMIETESLAGTAPRGRDPKEDDMRGRSLLGSRKEVREHSLVTDYIVNKLEPICETVDVAEMVLLKLSTLQHLYRKICGRLKMNISDAEILDALFPTPAVAGYPVEKSIDVLNGIERFSRGWYAGAIGFSGNKCSEYYVGIRSALMNRKKVYIYSGAGILKGSDPGREWDEIELKIQKYKKILNYEN